MSTDRWGAKPIAPKEVGPVPKRTTWVERRKAAIMHKCLCDACCKALPARMAMRKEKSSVSIEPDLEENEGDKP